MTPGQIFFFGDSITLADNDRPRLGWPGRLCAGLATGGLATTCYNLGINGDTSRDIAARWRTEVAARRLRGNVADTPALVFAYGFNDACEADGQGPQVPLDESLAVSRAMLTEAKAMAPVLWVGPTPLDESVNPMVSNGVSWDMRNADIVRYSAAYETLAAEIGVPYLPLHGAFLASARYLAALRAYDKVHPAADGYAMIAEAVAGWAAWRAMIDGG